MSKRPPKKTAQPKAVAAQKTSDAAVTAAFGFEEMLGELEAIIAEAEVRLAQEAALA
ncbi:hypothetical protein [Pluralibacter sp.]|uniref:hypothetical protein n=1 Tax=Pluralibacter sp. TaxID=1920032 RepID=UPI0025D575B3|nr:hypothetical protein [Pluralibacter sp.]MBV8044382.1 hypothetical protein [Pluralibacter sp.]